MDIDNVSLTTSAGSSVAGKVTTETGAAPGLARDRVRINTRSVAGMNAMSMQDGIRPRSVLNDDWTFSLTGVVSPARLLVTLPDGWITRAVLHAGRDIADTALELKDGEQLSGVQVVLSDRLTTMSGQLTDDKDAPLADGTAIVFSADSSKWFDGSRFIRAVAADHKGGYQIKGLPPGDYLAVAVDYVEQEMWNDPEYLESLRQHAQKVTLRDGDAQVVALKRVVQ